MMMTALAMAVSVAAGVLIAGLLLPLERRDPVALAFLMCMGAGVGAGVSSVVYFLLLLANAARYAIAVDLAVMLLLAALAFFHYKKRAPAGPAAERGSWAATALNRIVAAAFCGALVSSTVSLVAGFLREPHGRWDAWLIWNMHARFIHRSGENWREMFAGGLDWTHTDYPLMLPLSVVRAWLYQGGETVLAPMMLAMLFALAVIGLLVASVARFRRPGQGYLAGLALMGSPFFLVLAIYQVADIPLAFFILAAIVCCYMSDREEKGAHGILLLGGMAAGLACWTKNEGMLFLVALLAGRLVTAAVRDGWKAALGNAAWLLAGAAPVLLAVVYFKAALAPPNDLFSGQSAQQIFQRLADPGRYAEILRAFFQTAATFTQGVVNIRAGVNFNPAVVGIILLAVYLALSGLIDRGRERSAALSTLAAPLIMLAGFFGVYLVTPHDLRWHLFTSLNRLFMQIWPVLIFACFLLARTPAEALARDAAGSGAQGGAGVKNAGKTGAKKGKVRARQQTAAGGR